MTTDTPLPPPALPPPPADAPPGMAKMEVSARQTAQCNGGGNAEKMILPVQLADGSSKSLVVSGDTTVRQVIAAVLAKTHAVRSSNDADDDWRLVAVRPLRRAGLSFTLGELNATDAVRVLDHEAVMVKEMAALSPPALPASTVTGDHVLHAGNDMQPRIKLLNTSCAIRVSFRQVPEIPEPYACTFYVSPNMTAELVTQTIIGELSLRAGVFVSGSDAPASAAPNLTGKTRYSLTEIKEFSNGVTETRRLNDSDMPLALRAAVQPMLASRALFDYRFELVAQANWFTRLRFKELMRPAYKAAEIATGEASTTASSSPTKTAVAQLVGDGVLDQSMDKATAALANLPEDAFDSLYEAMLLELNIKNEGVRKTMLAYSKDRKAMLLVQNYRNSESPSSPVTGLTDGHAPSSGGLFGSLLNVAAPKPADRTPEYYIEKLNGRHGTRKALLKNLGALRITLSTASLSWIRQFVDNSRGIVAMAGVLDRSLTQKRGGASSDVDEEIRAECVKSFRILLNTEPGFVTVLSSQMVVSKIAFCLFTTNDRLRTTVAEVLAAICVISGETGQKMVLTAFGDFRGFYNERYRFEYLLESLTGTDPLLSTMSGAFSDSRNPVAAFEYKTTAMSLINAIVTTPEALDVRIQLRNEFQQRGLDAQQIAKLRKDAPAALITQLDLCEEEMAEDLKEAEVFIKANKSDLGDPQVILKHILVKVNDDPLLKMPMIVTLQNLLLMSTARSSNAEDSMHSLRHRMALMELFSQKLVDLHAANGISPQILAPILHDAITSLAASHWDTSAGDTDTCAQLVFEMLTTIGKRRATLRPPSPPVDSEMGELSRAIFADLNMSPASAVMSSSESSVALQLKLDDVIKELEEATSKSLDQHANILALENQNKQLSERLAELENAAASKNSLEASVANDSELAARVKELEAQLEEIKGTTIDTAVSDAHVSTLSNAPPAPPPPPVAGASANPVVPLPPVDETSSSVPPPPPPPMPGMSATGATIPPPPPPPPGTHGTAGGPPPPPPMPGAPVVPAFSLPPKPIVKARVPLKQFFWSKLPVAAVDKSLWKNMDESDVMNKLNKTELEQLFAKAAPKPSSSKRASGDESGNAGTAPKKPQTTLIDLNRANNVAIMLARVKLSYADMCKAIMALDDKVLSVDQIKALKQFVPTDDEREAISEYIASAGVGEQYFYHVMKIPRLPQRLQSWIYKRKFTSDVSELKLEMDTMQSAVNEVRSSKRLHALLKTVLAVGNYLNGGSSRGQAYGYQLDALLKMSDTRSNVAASDDTTAADESVLGVTSLMHYLVAQSDKSSSSKFVDFADEMPHLDGAARVSLQSLQTQTRALRVGLDQIKHGLKSSDGSIVGDRFSDVMTKFTTDADAIIGSIENALSALESSSKQLLVYVGEDESKAKIEDFLSTLMSFAHMVTKARKEIADAHEKAKQPTMPVINATKRPAGAPLMEKGDLENAIRQLKQGTGLRKGRSRRTAPTEDVALGVGGPSPAPGPLGVSSDAILRLQQQRLNLEKAIQKR